MTLQVDFITLGDASERLGVPSPTLRNWTDQLEEFDVHYIMRNNRNERIYFASDLKIFEFLRDLKEEYGRRTTTRDLAGMLAQRGEEGKFELRSKEDAPLPTDRPSNKVNELLNQEDIQRLMQSDRVKQFVGYIVAETQRSIINDLQEEITKQVRAELVESQKASEEREKEREKREIERINRLEELLKKRDEQTTQWLSEMREQKKQDDEKREEEANKSFWQRVFGK